MTMSTKAHDYLLSLATGIYSLFGATSLRPYPNTLLPHHEGKVITQYHFNTASLPIFSVLHALWYRWDDNSHSFIKIVPECVSSMFGPIALAHWIMEDGYFDSWSDYFLLEIENNRYLVRDERAQTILLCTECFSKEECLLLVLNDFSFYFKVEWGKKALSEMGILSTLKWRNKDKGTFRVRISKTSMPLVRQLVTPYMHSTFMYKLGPSLNLKLFRELIARTPLREN